MRLNRDERRKFNNWEKFARGVGERQAKIITRAERREKLRGKRPKLRSTGIAIRKW